MAVPDGASRVDYNFTAFTSGGDPTYIATFQMTLEDVPGWGLTTTQERNDIVQVGMDALLAELNTRYPDHTVGAVRNYVVPPAAGDPWPAP